AVTTSPCFVWTAKPAASTSPAITPPSAILRSSFSSILQRRVELPSLRKRESGSIGSSPTGKKQPHRTAVKAASRGAETSSVHLLLARCFHRFRSANGVSRLAEGTVIQLVSQLEVRILGFHEFLAIPVDGHFHRNFYTFH